MTTRTDELLDAAWPPPEERVIETPRKCRHPRWRRIPAMGDIPASCGACGKALDPVLARRGKQSRNYGNRAELAVARKYGGTKVGHAGGPVDVRGVDFSTQVKTHRRPPPREWVGVFNALSANRERCPRLLLRFVMGPGVPPKDYLVFEAEDFLDWFGRDEETPRVR